MVSSWRGACGAKARRCLDGQLDGLVHAALLGLVVVVEEIAVQTCLHDACGARALGAYRGLYLLNWIYRYMTEEDYVQRIVWIAGVVQTGLYCDFFYHYYESKRGGLNRPVKLPV